MTTGSLLWRGMIVGFVAALLSFGLLKVVGEPAVDDAAVVERDGWVNEIAAKRPQARKNALLVDAGEPAVADHIRDQDRREFPGLAHSRPSAEI